ncbi:MAG: hypothetical protein M3T55_00715 [Pseudomonadota bacterium]|nr:hypothetical protein [Pseudomonadota bacterium]
MAEFRRNRNLTIAIERGFLAVIAIGWIYTLFMFFRDGFLQPPFSYDTIDNFMDWYNTAYWANNPGAYDVWGTVYPPFAFVFLRLFSLKACYFDGPFAGRACDWLGVTTLLSFFVINAVIVYKCYRLKDKSTALVRAAALCCGLVLVFSVDRGNLIVPCFTCFALGHGRLLRSAKLRWLAIAMSINFKPYLISALAPLIIRRRWRWFEGAVVAVVLVYLASWAAFGAGSPAEVFGNIFAYQGEGGNVPFAAMFYGSSYTSILALARSVPLTSFVGSHIVELLDPVPAILIRVGQLGVLASFLGAALRPNAVPTYRLTALAVALAMTTVEVGGYAESFLLFLVFLEPWKGPARIVALVSAYLLCVPMDHLAINLYRQIKPDYLSGRTIGYNFGVSVGMFIRPGLILVIQYALSFATLRDVMRVGKPAIGCPGGDAIAAGEPV